VLDLKRQRLRNLWEPHGFCAIYTTTAQRAWQTHPRAWIVLFRLREARGAAQSILADVLTPTDISLLRLLASRSSTGCLERVPIEGPMSDQPTVSDQNLAAGLVDYLDSLRRRHRD